MKSLTFIACSLAFAASATTARAEPEPRERRAIEANTSADSLPPSQSDDDPAPQVPSPAPPPGGIVEQAGKGGVVSYARTGVIELGGNAGLAAASGFLRFSVAPSIGWFIIDNIELSAMIGLSHVRIDTTADSGASETASQTLFSFLLEPSVHIPFTRTLFGFLGVGMGVAYADESGAGFALQPRVGLNILVGRSGVLSPALYVQYTTTSAIQTESGTLLQVDFGYGLNVGYTVMW